MAKKLTTKEFVSRTIAGALVFIAAVILIPTVIRQLRTESFSLKANVHPEIAVSDSFADPTGVLNMIAQKRYEEAKVELKYLRTKFPEVPATLIEYFEEYFKFSGYLETNPFDQAEYLIRKYATLEKYLLKNNKSNEDVYLLSAVIPFDVITQIYDFLNINPSASASPVTCANFKRLCKLYEEAIIVGAHNEKLTERDARILCMKENFCYMRSVLGEFGNKNTRINERREIAYDIVRLKGDYPDYLTEEGKFKEVSRYLEALQLECENRNQMFWDKSKVTDFTALP